VTAFLPDRINGPIPEPDHAALRQREQSVEENRQRWEVRAAQWRAHELATEIFGAVYGSSMLGLRTSGDVRGLLHLEVPFASVDVHKEREAIFMSCVTSDPILSRIDLIYVVGPEAA
jgi:hypothetical protein